MPESLVDIQSSFQILQAEHEALCQRLHELEMNKKLLTSTLNELKEIALQPENNIDEKQAVELEKCRIKKIKLQSQARREQDFSEIEMLAKNNEIEALRSQLAIELKRVEDNSFSNFEDSKQETVISLLQDEHNLLFETLEDLHTQLNSKGNEHLAQLDKAKELEDEINHYKEIVHCKQVEFENTTLKLNSFQEKYFDLKAEIDAATNKPLDTEIRGNSLFAEIDDRRIQLEDNIQKMKIQYLEMKRQQSADLKVIATLRSDNVKLSTEIKKMLDEHLVDEERKIIRLQEEVTKLTELIEDYKNQIVETLKGETSIYSRLDIFKCFVDRKNEELRDVRDQLQFKAKDNVSLTFKMSNYQKELQIRETEIMKLESDIGELKTVIIKCKTEIDENILSSKEADNAEDYQREKTKKLKPIMKTTAKFEKTAAAVKCVQFPTGSLNDNVSERSSRRRGMKVPSTEKMHFF